MMKAIGNNVVIETTLTSKEKKVILLGDEANKDKYEAKHIIISVGNGNEVEKSEVKVGDEPIFAHYYEPFHSENVSGKEGDDKIIQQSIAGIGQIVGIRDKK